MMANNEAAKAPAPRRPTAEQLRRELERMEKKRGMGAVICTCPQPDLLRENILELPVWYI